jgi:hypothetical protein
MKNTVLLITCLLFIKLNVTAQILPKAWTKSGTWAGSYSMKIKPNEGLNNSNALELESIEKNIMGSGAVIQTISSSNYIGKRIKLSAYIKTEKVNDFACLILCSNQNLDELWNDVVTNSEDKKTYLKGVHEYKKIECYLNVTDNFGNIVLGAMIKGEGKIWLDRFNLEIIENIAESGNELSKAPQNMEFEDSLSISPINRIGYRIDNDYVIFSFIPSQFKETTDGMTGWRKNISKEKIKQVYVAGNFNNWDPKNRLFLMQENGNSYELKIPINTFAKNVINEFKFVINGEKWVEPITEMVNKTQSGNWVGNNNLMLILP